MRLRERITSSEARRKGVCMEQVVGIGGVFFKTRDPKALAAWYREHLGVPAEPTAETDRGRHPGFSSFSVLAGGPGSLAERSGGARRSDRPRHVGPLVRRLNGEYTRRRFISVVRGC